MSSDIQTENPPAQPVPAHATPGSVSERLLPLPPGVISVMCPTGYTPCAIEGLAIGQPLFARVTYRPA